MTDGLDFLLEPPAPPTDTYRWGTVTSTSPLRVRLDGDPAPVASEPDTLQPVSAGNRVWVQIHGRQMVIIGSAKNQAGQPATPGSAILAPGLPAPMRWVGPSQQSITASEWEQVTGGQLGSMTLDLPMQAWVEVSLSAWVTSVNSSDVRAGIAAVGANIITPSNPSWSAAIWASGESQAALGVRKTMLFQPGITTLMLMAYRNRATGTAGLNYSLVSAEVLRWA